MSPLCLLGSLFTIAILCLLLLLVRWCWRLSARIEGLDRISTLDPLTGLPNGRLFESERWPAAVRASDPLCLLYIDFDDLKPTNDRYGRSMGDRYIVRGATLLRQACRRGLDPLFRLNTAGDEFLLLLLGKDALFGDTVARHILCFLLREGISASIGVASTRSTNHQIRAALLEQAEQAMRQAKREGKGRFAVFAPPAASPDSRPEAIPEAIHENPVLPVRRQS